MRTRRRLTGSAGRGWLGSALLLAATVAAPAPAAHAAPTTDRISGPDRYATSVAASRQAFPRPAGPAGPDTVYLASGHDHADALGAGPAAAVHGAALLLTERDRLPTVVATELRRLAPSHVVVVGLQGAVSDRVAASARAIVPDVQRIGGIDRYATSLALARSAFGTSGAHTAYIATGHGFADALAAGPAAAVQGGPVVLVPGSATSLPRGTRELLADLRVQTTTIAGGPAVVSSGIEAGLRALLGTAAVTRAAGADRYLTAIAVNRRAFPALLPGDAYVARGSGFADALSVSVLAARSKRPLFLSSPFCAGASLRTELSRPAFTRIRLVGGPAAVRGLVGRLEACRSTTSASSEWVVVNKKRRLDPVRYVPSPLVSPSVHNINGQPLRKDAATALAAMFTAARAEGAGRMAQLSGYRSYGYQSSVYNAKVASTGVAEADRWVARPGYSEHQTGLALDIAPVGASGCSSYTCIASTPQGRWLRANAWRFGFVLRYESGQSAVTGYSPEPWHFRYVGTALARDYREGGFHSLEAYFELPAAASY